MRKKLSLDLTLVDIPTINLPTKGELIIHDEGVPALSLRLRASGARTWVVRSNQDGINRRQTLGDALSLPLFHARRLAQATDDGAGVDTAALPEHITVSDILPRYLAYGRKGLWKPSTARLMRYVALRHILPKFGKRAIRDIKPADVVVWHQTLANRTSSDRMALSTLSGLMGYAEDHGVRPMGSNPCKWLRKKAKAGRGSYLPNGLIKGLWASLNALQEEMRDACDAIRLLLLTGARRQEILGLRWDAIAGHRAVLEDAKEGPRTIWLNTPAKSLLDERRERITGDYVFPAKRLDGPRTNIDREWKAIRSHAGILGLRLHDLRHHFAAVGVSNGIDLKLVGQLLGHREIESTLIYAHLSTASLTRSASRVSELIDRALCANQPPSRPRPLPSPIRSIRARRAAKSARKAVSHA